MSLLDRFRTDPPTRLLRSEPVLALPAHLASAQVATYAREWDPGAVPEGPRILKVNDNIELHGPLSYDETLWRRAKMPSDCTVAYAARELRTGDDEWTGAPGSLIAGLCDRIGGSWRRGVRDHWTDGDTDPSDPWVYAPRMLAEEELLHLLAPLVPGAAISHRAGSSYYSVNAEPLLIMVDAEDGDIYPQVKLQPWFASAERVTEYQILSDDTSAALQLATRVAGAIAEATGGLVVAEYGFPWRGR